MEESIKRVIKLLEDGKITAEEAERLIKAIKELSKKEEECKETIEGSAKQEPYPGDLPNQIFKMVGDIINETIKSSTGLIRKKTAEMDIEIEKKDNIFINVLGGDIDISSWDSQLIKGNLRGAYNVGEDFFKMTVNGDTTLQLPENVNLTVSLLGGDGKISGVFNEVTLSAMGGDLELDLDFKRLKIVSYGGDIMILLPKKPVKIYPTSFGGSIELPENVKYVGDYYVYGEDNFKELMIRLFGGNLVLKFREAQNER